MGKQTRLHVLGEVSPESAKFLKSKGAVVHSIYKSKEQKLQDNINFLTSKFEEARKKGNTKAASTYSEQIEELRGVRERKLLMIKLDEKIQNLHNNTELEKRYYSQKLYNLQLLSTFLFIILAFSFLLYVYIIWRNKIKNIMIKSTEKIKNMKLEIPKKKQNIKEIIEDVKEKYISKMDDNEIIIISIIISTIIASALGYCTGETLYFKNNGDRGSLEHHSYSEFHINYFIVIISFIISGGLSYLYLKKNRK